MKEVKLLLVGIGGYGAFYMNELEKMEDSSVVLEGVCDAVCGMEDRYPMIKERKIPAYTSIAAFYREHRADLAIIATPIQFHYAQALECLSHNSNVLVEKPVSAAIWEAKDMMAKAKEAGKFVSVGYQMNYGPGLLAMKRDILSGKFGKPLYFKAIHAFKRGRGYYHRNRWAGKILVDGKPVNDSPVNNSNAHQFQNMTFLLGEAMDCSAEVSQVEAELYRADAQVENFDTAALRAMTKSQVPIFYYTTHNCHEAELGPVSEFHFEKGSIYLGGEGQGVQAEYVACMEGCPRVSYGPAPTAWSMEKLYDAIACIREGGSPVCTVQAAIPHLDVVSRLAGLPIRPIAPDCIETEEKEGDTFFSIKNLEGVYRDCYERLLLPSQAGAGW